jgi:hypothetical protein
MSSTTQRQFGLYFIGILLVIVLVIGGVFVGVRVNRRAQDVNLAPIATSEPTVSLLPIPTTAPVNVPLGTQLYRVSSPGCDKGGRGRWEPYNGAQVSCQGNKTTIINPSQTGGLAGIFLTELPGRNYPANYVIRAQLQQENYNSSSDFGIYFRNQLGKQQLGVYTFLVHPDGTWNAYVYDNTTGVATQMPGGGTIEDRRAIVNLMVVVNGQQFSFYANGRALGSVSDQTYASGTAGIAVDQGGSIIVSNFALYTTPQTDGY